MSMKITLEQAKMVLNAVAAENAREEARTELDNWCSRYSELHATPFMMDDEHGVPTERANSLDDAEALMVLCETWKYDPQKKEKQEKAYEIIESLVPFHISDDAWWACDRDEQSVLFEIER